MDKSNVRIKIFIGSVIVLLLQIFLSPVISINNVLPNFLAAFVIACVVARPDQQHLFFAFIMGIIYDLIANGPVGAMAFVLLVVVFVLSRALVRLGTTNTGILILAICLGLIVVELLYGVFQVSLLLDTTFVDMIIYRAFPCGVYDIILGLIFFPIMVRLLAPPATHSAYYSGTEDLNNRG